MNKFILVLFSMFCIAESGWSQQRDLLITYDANQGVSNLAGSRKVYMYAAAVTSSPGGQWEWIAGSTNLDDGIGIMTAQGNNSWSICIDPDQYYNAGVSQVPAGAEILAVNLYFRNEYGTATGYSANGRYITIDMTTNPPTSDFPGVSIGFCTTKVPEAGPMEVSLSCSPNPVKATTGITYNLRTPSHEVEVIIFDVIGQKVKTISQGQQKAGAYKVTWSGESDKGTPLKNGLYFYSLVADGVTLRTSRMVISK